MKFSDLTLDELRLARTELDLSRRRYISRAFGDLEQYYLDLADSLTSVINIIESVIIERTLENAI